MGELFVGFVIGVMFGAWAAGFYFLASFFFPLPPFSPEQYAAGVALAGLAFIPVGFAS